MKRFNMLLAVIIMLFVMVMPVQAATCNCGYIKTSGELKKLPQAFAKTVITVDKYDQVEINSTAGDWYGVKVMHNTKIYKGYIVKSAVQKENTKNRTGRIVKAVQMYKKSNGTKKLVKLSKNDFIKILSWNKKRLKVEAEHKGWIYQGWIQGLYVSVKPSNIQITTPIPQPTPVPTPEPIKIGYVNWWHLYLRKYPNTDCEIVAELSANDVLELGDLKDGWYTVKAHHEGQAYSGYVWSGYVSNTPLTEHQLEEVGQNWITDNKQVLGYVNYTYLNLRKLPTTDSEIVVKLALNDIVEILAENGGWYEVSVWHNGTEYYGWVAQQYITKS